VSWKPRAFIYHNFLSDAEAEHIKQLAAPTVSHYRTFVGVSSWTYVPQQHYSTAQHGTAAWQGRSLRRQHGLYPVLYIAASHFACKQKQLSNRLAWQARMPTCLLFPCRHVRVHACPDEALYSSVS
jgi:hypothetical protein